MTDLSIRSYAPEIMDQPNVSADETREALREINFINATLGGDNVTINALEKLDWPDKTVTIIDLGCGSGGSLRVIAAWALQKKRSVRLIGIDWNNVMTDYASSLSADYPNIQFKAMDVFDPALQKEQADIATNCLFCHHFDEEQLIRMLRNMYHMSSQAVIINDLDRHWLAYYSIKFLTAVFSKTYLVKYDAPLSVARALTRREWEAVLDRAGFEDYSLRWMWAWRWQLIIKKSKANDE